MNRWYNMDKKSIILNKLKNASILVVEDGEDISRLLEYTFKLITQDIKIAKNGIEALELLKTFKPNVVITDLNMPHMNGSDLIVHIKALFPNMPIIVTSGFIDDLKNPELVYKIFEKPIIFSELLDAIIDATKS
jgi:DNA-binding NtrC family response regulator